MNTTTEGALGSANSGTLYPYADEQLGVYISPGNTHPFDGSEADWASFKHACAQRDKLARQLAHSEERVKELEEVLREAQKDAEDMLGMIEDYDGLDWGEDGPPFTPCVEELQERIDQRAALLSSFKTN